MELPLSPKSELHWIGWDEDGSIITVDTSGIVRSLVFSTQPRLFQGKLLSEKKANGMWTPIGSLPNDEDLFHWVVGCTKEQIVFVECNAGDRYPILMPFYTPPLCSLSYTAPLLPQTPAGENQLFVDRIHLQTTNDVAEQVSKQQQLDKSILRLFHGSCNDDKLQRALDFAQLLKFPKAMDIAIQVASSANITSLVEHLSEIKSIILSNVATNPAPVIPVSVPTSRNVSDKSKTKKVQQETEIEDDECSEEDSERVIEKENIRERVELADTLKQVKKSNTPEKPKRLQNDSKFFFEWCLFC